MKHLIASFVICVVAVIAVDAQNIQYYRYESDKAEVAKCSDGSSVAIPEKVTVDGQQCTVTRIGRYAFYGNSSLQTISLPSTIMSVGEKAFYGCSNLKVVYGDKKLLSKYFSSNVTFKESYSTYAKRRVTQLVEEWQKKGEFETTAQWQVRVTEQSRNAKVTAFIEQARKEYLEQNAVTIAREEIGTYDADNGIFPIHIYGSNDTDLGNVYAKVPMSDAQSFKQNFTDVTITPQYGIVNDGIGIVNCTFRMSGKSYASTQTYTEQDNSQLAINLPPLQITVNGNEQQVASAQPTKPKVDNSIDLNIPVNEPNNTKTFALIIGNENYQSVENVAYAANDAKIFAEYCTKTLGLPEKNVTVLIDASYAHMLSALQHMKDIAEVYSGDVRVIFYYAGHGIPDEVSRNAFLLPVDADGRQTEVCLATSRLYSEFSSMNARQVLVFMDACFSGAQRGSGMLASARGVALKVNESKPRGNMIVFSAATGDQTAYPYEEKGHGMFTYFLLKKLRDTRGNVTLGELSDYVYTEVNRQSVVVNQKKQTPTVTPAEAVINSWRVSNLK